MSVKYHVDGLCDMAVEKFKAEVADHWNHEDLAHAIHVIYTSTADEVTQLRELAAKVLSEHLDELMEKPEVATLLRSINGLAYDILVRGRSSTQGTRLAGPVRVPCYQPKWHGLGSQHAWVYCSTCKAVMQVCNLCHATEVTRKWKCSGCQ